MADRIVRVGIIGCGGIANGKHMPSLKKVKNVQMVAFCDVVEERAVKAAKEYGTEDAKVYTDYKELLKDDSIEVVHVLTPNNAHAPLTIDALEAGKHVMCEKPMAKTYAEAKAMLDLIFASRVYDLGEFFQFGAFNSAFLRMWTNKTNENVATLYQQYDSKVTAAISQFIEKVVKE